MFNFLNNKYWKIVESPKLEELSTVAQKDEEGYVCWNVGDSRCIWLPNMEVKDVYKYVKISNLFSHIDKLDSDMIIIYGDKYGILSSVVGDKKVCFINYTDETEEMKKAQKLNGLEDLNLVEYENIFDDDKLTKTIITLDEDITKLYNFENVKNGILFTEENNKAIISIFDYSVVMFGLSLNKNYYFKLDKVITDKEWSIINFVKKEE